ncbi:UNVERIFIED_ORG: hypothetical protein J2X79_002534 [Arthrobacter globiformis]|nr:hypothetical protein [Arthrobacter globiformis]
MGTAVLHGVSRRPWPWAHTRKWATDQSPARHSAVRVK